MLGLLIREDEIKMMKDIKNDILEIMPKISSVDGEEDDVESFKEKSFEEIFRDFYFKEREVEPSDEVVDTLLSIISEEDEEDEAN